MKWAFGADNVVCILVQSHHINKEYPLEYPKKTEEIQCRTNTKQQQQEQRPNSTELNCRSMIKIENRLLAHRCFMHLPVNVARPHIHKSVIQSREEKKNEKGSYIIQRQKRHPFPIKRRQTQIYIILCKVYYTFFLVIFIEVYLIFSPSHQTSFDDSILMGFLARVFGLERKEAFYI